MNGITIKTIKGQIEVVTGLHIGAGSDTIEIGGMDNPILRNPSNNEPYIPGSSIKGKMRSLMEWAEGKAIENIDSGDAGKVHSCAEVDCKICRVFGAGANTQNTNDLRGPTRLIVRDAILSEESRKGYIDNNKILIEEKYENSINRITAAANPRPIERVVPGTKFDFNISYKVLDMGDGPDTDEKYFKEVVLKALALLEKDYLGGGGSRGNGQIKFVNLTDENGEKIELPE